MHSRRTLCFVVLLGISLSLHASTVFLSSGKWSVLYSKNTVEAGTKLVITGDVTVDVPLLIEGTIEITKGASLLGLRTVYVTPAGRLLNQGSIVFNSLFNSGHITNNSIIELMYDLENDGILQNNHLINCGRAFYCNKGTVKGSNSRYYIGRFYRISKIVNLESENLSIKMSEVY